jgi:hypothetical protein
MAYAIGTMVFVRSLELIDSQTINLFHDEFEMKVADLQFHFLFKNNKNKKIGTFYISPKNDKKVTIELYNYSNSFIPMSYFEPLEMGYLNGRKLYINFSISTISAQQNARIFTYNIYLGDVSDG